MAQKALTEFPTALGLLRKGTGAWLRAGIVAVQSTIYKNHVPVMLLLSCLRASAPTKPPFSASKQCYGTHAEAEVCPEYDSTPLVAPCQRSALLGKVFKRQYISLLLLVIGVALLSYVGSEYWGMYHRQQQLAAQWEQQASATNIPGKAKISVDDLLTRVVIPKISLDAIVVEGASRRELSEGPGHMKKTAQPGEAGQRGYYRPSRYFFPSHLRTGQRR